ncbi:MAG: NAD(P)-binding domain-containing protein [Rickettsiales bacterium]|nr:NAD(P)-binding domain-containing protein [Rickettsiales bacterium]
MSSKYKCDNVSVIGCGRWGSFLSYYLATYCVQNVLLYGRENSKDFNCLKTTGKNEYLTLPQNITLTSNVEDALKNNIIVISIPCQNLRDLAKQLNNYNLEDKTFILAMKGLEQNTSKRLTEIIDEEIKYDVNTCVLLGPGHVQDYLKKVPSCAVVDSNNSDVKKYIANLFNSELMRVYYGNDLIGNEVGAALKNVIGIAAGILDGLDWYGLKGALMTRAPIEVGRIIKKFGGNPNSAYGLAHLGDYEATLFSKNSHNRQFGENLVKKTEFSKLAEGYYTLKAIYDFVKKTNTYAPICEALYDFVYEQQSIDTVIHGLFDRPIKGEFE